VAKRSVVVVGGGISGLAAAHRLLSIPGLDVTLLEASPTVGGKLTTCDVGGAELDAGAESVLARREEFRELVTDMGISDRLVAPAASGVDVVVAGERRRLPQRQLLGIPFDVEQLAASGVLDADALARTIDDGTTPPSEFADDVSVGEVVRTRMGEQVVERLVEPLLAGVYASSADDISLRTALPGLLEALSVHGSLAAAAAALVTDRNTDAKGFVGLVGGLGGLPAELAKRLTAAPNGHVHTSARATSLRSKQGGWVVDWESEGVPRTIESDGVILAVPAPAIGELLSDVSPKASAHLRSISYASVVLTTLVLAESDAPALPPGTGLLIPPNAGMLTKAVTYTSQKWKWVADAYPGRVVVRLSMGRADDERALALADDEVVAVACRELAAILKQPALPTATKVVRWPDSIPHYPVGHSARVSAIQGDIVDTPGLELCGAWLEGVGIPTCIGAAQEAATRLARDIA